MRLALILPFTRSNHIERNRTARSRAIDGTGLFDASDLRLALTEIEVKDALHARRELAREGVDRVPMMAII